MIRLNVPYEEKDDAKRLGAKWNGYGRYWYIENDKDYSLFSAWLSEEELELLRAIPSYALSDYMELIKEHSGCGCNNWSTPRVQQQKIGRAHV